MTIQAKAKHAAYMRAWRKKHPEKCRSYDRAYYEKHQENIKLHTSAYYAAHRKEAAITNRAYRAKHREERLAYGQAYRIEHQKDRIEYREEHREEAAAYSRAWAQANPEKIKAKGRRRRAHLRGATIGEIDYEAIRKRDRMRCCVCGLKVSEADMSYDHTIPLSFGGPHTQNNLRVCHLRCNSQRGAGRLPAQMVMV